MWGTKVTEETFLSPIRGEFGSVEGGDSKAVHLLSCNHIGNTHRAGIGPLYTTGVRSDVAGERIHIWYMSSVSRNKSERCFNSSLMPMKLH